MLTLLLSMHLLAAPLELVPQAHAEGPDLSLRSPRSRVIEAGLGGAMLALPLVAVPWAGRMIFTSINGCCSGGGPGFWGDQTNYFLMGLLFEAVVVPPLAALALRLASRVTGGEPRFVNAMLGAFVGNMLGLPAGVLVAGLGVYAAGNDHPLTLLLAIAAGAVVQSAFVAGTAALATEWGDEEAPAPAAAPVAPPTWTPSPSAPPPTAGRMTFPIFAMRF